MSLNFVYDSTALDFPKTNQFPVGPDPTKEIDAAHWNNVCQADYDIRGAIVTGKYFGFTAQASDPTPSNANKYWWLRTDDAWVVQTPGNVYQVALGLVTSKGDKLVFNGTKFGVLSVGSDGSALLADSTQTLGVKWGTLGPTWGGTGFTTYTLGDTIYSNASNSIAKLAGNTTSTRKFLRQTGTGVVSAAPVWDTLVAGDIPNIAGDVTGAYSGVTVVKLQGYGVSNSAPSAGYTLIWNNGTSSWTPGTLGGSSFPNQSANQVFAGPSSGGAAAPGFRALVANDIPNIAGDVTGAYSGVTVAKIQGNAVAINLPNNGDLFTWDSGVPNWKPASTIAGNKTWSGTATFSSTATFNGAFKPTSAMYVPVPITVNHAASPYTVQATDTVLAVDTSGGAVTINLPNDPDRELLIYDAMGTWSTSALTVVPPATGTIEGSASKTYGVNSQNLTLIADSTGKNWGALAKAWNTSAVLAGTGVSVSTSNGGVTINNTGVTSVALSAPGIFSVSGSPVTTTGTLTLSLATQTANLVFAGPASGGAVAPTFRSLVTADFPTTGVTAASYTYASITVDATGRLTAASSGTTPTLQAAYTSGGGNITLTVGGGALTAEYDNITSNDTVGLLVQNTTVTTANPQVQYSPTFRMQGHAWDVTASADKNVRFEQQVITQAGNSSTIRGSLAFKWSVDAGTTSFTQGMTLLTNGQILVPYQGGGITTPELAIQSGGGSDLLACSTGFYATSGAGNIGVALGDATYGYMFAVPSASNGFGPASGGNQRAYFGYNSASTTAVVYSTSTIGLDVRGYLGVGTSGADLVIGSQRGNRGAGTIVQVQDSSTVLSTFTRFGGQTWTLRQDPNGNNPATIELNDFTFDMSATRTWATGALTTQRAALFKAPTYAFAAASTISSAATVAITGAPAAGAFCTISSSYSLWVQAGQSRFDGDLYVGLSMTMGGITVGGTYTLGGTPTLGSSLLLSGDNTLSVGTSSNRLTQIWAYQHAGVCQSQASSTTPTYSPTSGETIYHLLSGNITSWTVNNGVASQILTIIWVQPAAGTGPYTISSPPSNVKMKGQWTLSQTPSARDAVVLRWDNVNSIWQEIGRSRYDGDMRPEYGDGSDGTLVFDGVATILGMVPSTNVYTMTRDIYATVMVVAAGVTVISSNYRIRAKYCIINNGVIQCNGNAANHLVVGAGLSAGSLGGSGGGGSGGAGSNGVGSAGNSTSPSHGGNGGGGGAGGGAAGGGGAATAPTSNEGTLRAAPAAYMGVLYNASSQLWFVVQGGAGGGGGGGGANVSAQGGAGGGGGGILWMAAPAIVNNGTMSANGGAGGGATYAGAGNSEGDGGGGGGGTVVTIGNFSGTTPTATHGNGGSGSGTGPAGSPGIDGTVIQINI